MVVPYPFSKAIFLYGDPIFVSRDAGVEEARLRIEHAMNALADEADERFDAMWKQSLHP